MKYQRLILCNAAAYEILEHATNYLGSRNAAYWVSDDDQQAIDILVEAHRAVGRIGVTPSWETAPNAFRKPRFEGLRWPDGLQNY